MNKFLLGAIVLLLLLVSVSLFPFTALDGYTHQLGSVAEILCLILMLINGTFMETIFYKIFIASILLLVLGAIFKIMHYPGGEEMIAVSFILIPLVYTLHFILKKSKDQLDVLKLLIVYVFFIPTPLVYYDVLSQEYSCIVYTVSHLVFWIAFIDFLVIGFRRKTLF